MRRLSTSFLDLFLLLLMSVVVMVKPVTEDAPEELTHFIVTAAWDSVRDDVDVWGRRCGVADSQCGYPRREIGNLRLHGDWTASIAAEQKDPTFGLETMTVDSIISGEYGFALQGFSIGKKPANVKVTIASVKPYQILIDRELTVEDGQWVSIGRVTIDPEGKVVDVNETLEVQIND